MEENQFQREEILIGKENIEKLNKSSIAIYGIGGVGSYVCEALARAGVGHLVLIDKDIISKSNINRQIHATHKTIGKHKIDIMKERVLDIYPKCNVEIYLPQELGFPEEDLITNDLNYVVDAVDTVTTKLKIIEKSYNLKVPIISCMGTGNKLDASKFKITDIFRTSVCPLAKVMRKELKLLGIKQLKVLYSEEKPNPIEKSKTIGSISFVPSVAGLLIAGEVIRDILGITDT